ncbi:hypothetical protein CDN97_22985 [Pantoea sp. AMG 501]|nr:hypothetical protein CDN97_22985 [Pantoea sp. AMG 501]
MSEKISELNAAHYFNNSPDEILSDMKSFNKKLQEEKNKKKQEPLSALFATVDIRVNTHEHTRPTTGVLSAVKSADLHGLTPSNLETIRTNARLYYSALPTSKSSADHHIHAPGGVLSPLQRPDSSAEVSSGQVVFSTSKSQHAGAVIASVPEGASTRRTGEEGNGPKRCQAGQNLISPAVTAFPPGYWLRQERARIGDGKKVSGLKEQRASDRAAAALRFPAGQRNPSAGASALIRNRATTVIDAAQSQAGLTTETRPGEPLPDAPAPKARMPAAAPRSSAGPRQHPAGMTALIQTSIAPAVQAGPDSASFTVDRRRNTPAPETRVAGTPRPAASTHLKAAVNVNPLQTPETTAAHGHYPTAGRLVPLRENPHVNGPDAAGSAPRALSGSDVQTADRKFQRQRTTSETASEDAVRPSVPVPPDTLPDKEGVRAAAQPRSFFRYRELEQGKAIPPSPLNENVALVLNYKFQRWPGNHSVRVVIPAQPSGNENLLLTPSGSRAGEALYSQFGQLTGYKPELTEPASERDERQSQDNQEEEAE